MAVGRVLYLDLARGLAVFFTVMRHTILLDASGGGEGDGLLGNAFLPLGTAPAAPVFALFTGLQCLSWGTFDSLPARIGGTD